MTCQVQDNCGLAGETCLSVRYNHMASPKVTPLVKCAGRELELLAEVLQERTIVGTDLAPGMVAVAEARLQNKLPEHYLYGTSLIAPQDVSAPRVSLPVGVPTLLWCLCCTSIVFVP